MGVSFPPDPASWLVSGASEPEGNSVRRLWSAAAFSSGWFLSASVAKSHTQERRTAVGDSPTKQKPLCLRPIPLFPGPFEHPRLSVETCLRQCETHWLSHLGACFFRATVSRPDQEKTHTETDADIGAEHATVNLPALNVISTGSCRCRWQMQVSFMPECGATTGFALSGILPAPAISFSVALQIKTKPELLSCA